MLLLLMWGGGAFFNDAIEMGSGAVIYTCIYVYSLIKIG
jgi:hypothetical protein